MTATTTFALRSINEAFDSPLMQQKRLWEPLSEVFNKVDSLEEEELHFRVDWLPVDSLQSKVWLSMTVHFRKNGDEDWCGLVTLKHENIRGDFKLDCVFASRFAMRVYLQKVLLEQFLQKA